MPLLPRDNSRGGGGSGGGSSQSRRSLADIFNSDASEVTGDVAAPRTNLPNGLGCDGRWRWEGPTSPAAAPGPAALVPAACFPPRDHPNAQHNFSERARPASWTSEPYDDMADLLESFKSLGVSGVSGVSGGARGDRSRHKRLSCLLQVEDFTEEGPCAPSKEDDRAVARRASFCGALERSARLLSWSGCLPPRCMDASAPGGFSAKVFLGGLPWDISEEALLHALHDFRPVRVEWPGREAAPRGFAYVTLENEHCVRALLGAARAERGKWLYRVATRQARAKDVEVIPWAVEDSNWSVQEGGGSGGGAPSWMRLEAARTVFVGGLHGVLSALALATIMNDLFGSVVYAGIDTDKNKYPIGSGRVAFSDAHSYVRAISAGYVEVRTDKFVKKIQVDPYLEDTMCSVCELQQGPYFCREPVCFSYFCRTCWAWKHPNDEHKALMRNSKSVSLGNCNGGSSSKGHGSTSTSTSTNTNSNGELAPMCNGFTRAVATSTPSTPSPPASGGSGGSGRSGRSGGSGAAEEAMTATSVWHVA